LVLCIKASAEPKMTNFGWAMLHAARKVEASQK